uniref:(northern house mosquito) hypothetical protein n=1 Tax=Culex pipiens TaxID=7175 RepID=A0A8D8JPP7_CULPI
MARAPFLPPRYRIQTEKFRPLLTCKRRMLKRKPSCKDEQTSRVRIQNPASKSASEVHPVLFEGFAIFQSCPSRRNPSNPPFYRRLQHGRPVTPSHECHAVILPLEEDAKVQKTRQIREKTQTFRSKPCCAK